MLTSLFLSSRAYPSLINNSSLNPNQNPSSNAAKISQFDQFRENRGLPDASIKIPTAPWMKGPLLLRPDEIPDTKKRIKSKNVEEKTFKALNRRESGVRGRKAMKKIVRNVEKLHENRDSEETQMDELSEFEYLDRIAEKTESSGKRFGGKMPWDREEERFILRRTKEERVPTTAELILDKELLNRLRREASKMRKWVNVRKAGVTEIVVNEIRLIWKSNELAMVRFDVPLCRNMERAQEIIEVWLVLTSFICWKLVKNMFL